MKKQFLTLSIAFFSLWLYGQNENPFSQFGYEAPVMSVNHKKISNELNKLFIINTDTTSNIGMLEMSVPNRYIAFFDWDGNFLYRDTLTVYSVARWLSVDPAGQYNSPYIGMGNNPIINVDPDGAFDTKFGAWLYSKFNGGGDIRYANDMGEWFVGNSVEYTGEGIGVAYQRVFESNSRAFNYFDYRLDYTRDFFGGIHDFTNTYSEMREANWVNSDKYFHSKANFKASQRGPGGEYAAVKMSNLREIIDQRVKGDKREWSLQDQEANRYGRAQGRDYRGQKIGTINYSEAIPKYRPALLPQQY